MAVMVGKGAMTNSIEELAGTDLLLVAGSNTTEAHPVISLRMKRAVRNGAKLIVIDPRKTELTKWATRHLRIKIGTDIPLFNALAHVMIKEDLIDRDYVDNRTEGFDELAKHIELYTPDLAAEICGIPAEEIIATAREYAAANGKAAICYTLGITEHSCGSHNVQSVANLGMLGGNFGKPNAGVNPLRGQNNVQGASDSGALPTDLPGYQKIERPGVREKFEKAWNAELPKRRGITKITAMDQMLRGRVKGVYIMGENTVVSDPNTNHAQAALEATEFIVVQDIFMTDTAKLADVVLPAATFAESDGTFANSERRVQRVRPAIKPVGESRTDVNILLDLMARFNIDQNLQSASDAWDEMRQLSPLFGGISYERLDNEGGIQWPCPTEDHPGTQYLHKDEMDSGLPGYFAPVDHIPPAEQTDSEYPLVLTTGRRRSTYHTGTQTGRASGFELLVPSELAEINSYDAEQLELKDGQTVTVSSRRGSVEVPIKITDRSPHGTIFMSFAFPELTQTNRLTSDAYDFITETPEFKACAVRIDKIESSTTAT
ncbi:molybdopterin-dependent oxidoreductase [Candidatus Lucifugimonas marina]|nr:molybdopterin-dependent oxidoreductase [SAR202 cluster bacterium JH702]MDG0868650.1 molybdopterin-dependent oxidoreductase [SAR202 cluster bacterium JH639]WFG35282.1 molybdopterin-dependent oxidoreductase [SAR202 cluster bacterium JH545]WFG39232.1 molybdopterin-dependent oxidoreductase [SAR202 cluster bacterium JH1073]